MSNVNANTEKPKRDKYTWLTLHGNMITMPTVFTRMSTPARKGAPSIENQGLHRPKTKNNLKN